MDQFARFIQDAADAMFMPWTVGILLAAGILFTVRTGFVQIRRLPEAFRSTLASQQAGAGGALSPFQAFMTALAATIGVGNIAGVAAAIISGGPGALFWIWCYGFFAAAIKFAEAALGLRFRIAAGAGTLAGPMYYLRDGLGSPALAWIYALVAGVACLLTTPFTQPNSIAVVLDAQLKDHQLDLGRWNPGLDILPATGLELNRLAVGAVLAVLTWLVIIGGVKSIGLVAEFLSPLKVGFYMIGGLIVIGMNISKLPDVLSLVFHEAFSLRSVEGAAVGGFISTVMGRGLRYGFARGGYATEAGYGTAAVVYGMAKSDRPAQQGLNAMMEVFIITFITCTISALTILLTGTYAIEGIEGPAAVSAAFNTAMPTVGGWMLGFSVLLFGYTTLMGWSFYGEQFLEYLFGPRIIMPYRWVYCALIPLGAIAKVDLVWAWGDMLNGSQIFPNLIGLFALSGVAATFAKRREERSAKPE
jgi:AGCS family alanine or glycine:cation symporter